MAFVRVRTIKKRRYRYLQWSYRVAGKRTPKTGTLYLGPEEGFFSRNFKIKPSGTPAGREDELLAQYNKIVADEQKARDAAMEKLHEAYGMTMGPRNPTPVEKEVAPVVPSDHVSEPSASSQAEVPGETSSTT
jgi:hypothetical protein